MVGEMSVRGNAFVGEMFSRGSVLWGSVRSGNCPFREMFVGKVSVGEVSVGDLYSGKCPVGKLSYNLLQDASGQGKGSNKLYKKFLSTNRYIISGESSPNFYQIGVLLSDAVYQNINEKCTLFLINNSFSSVFWKIQI